MRVNRKVVVLRARTSLAFHGISGHAVLPQGLTPDLTLPRDPLTTLPIFYATKGFVKHFLKREGKSLNMDKCYFTPAITVGMLDVERKEFRKVKGYKGKTADVWLKRWCVPWSEVLEILKTLEGMKDLKQGKNISTESIIDVYPRNKIIKDKGTAETTWKEEVLVENTILVFAIYCEDKEILDELENIFGQRNPQRGEPSRAKLHHIGGGITYGHGMVEILTDGGDDANERD